MSCISIDGCGPAIYAAFRSSRPSCMTARDFADLMDALVVKERMQANIGILSKAVIKPARLPGSDTTRRHRPLPAALKKSACAPA